MGSPGLLASALALWPKIIVRVESGDCNARTVDVPELPRSVHASAQILRDFRTEPWVARTHRPDSARPREHHGTRSSRTAEEHALGGPAHAHEVRP